MPKLDLKSPPKRTRFGAFRINESLQVDRDTRTIMGVAIVTRGEALGHDLWLDMDFVQSIETLGAAALGRGVKSRFGHPSLSADGTGKALGRFRSFSRDGDKVRAHLSLLDSARNAPSGNLSDYVLSLAEEDPEIFGTSIVFVRDQTAERAFFEANSVDGVFTSPDPMNVNNLPHARARALAAVDVVDDPAANPDGFFDANGELLVNVEKFLAYVLGDTDEVPQLDVGINPTRAREFLYRYFVNRGLTLQSVADAEKTAPQEGGHMSTAKKDEGGAAPVATSQAPTASLSELKATFHDAGFVLECLEANRTMEESITLWNERKIAALEVEVQELREENAALKAKTSHVKPATEVDGVEPLSHSSSEHSGDDFIQLVEEERDRQHPNLTGSERAMRKGMFNALQVARRKYPEAYAAYRRRNGFAERTA